MWIDVLCVKQDDKAEQILQVSQMGRYYEKASKCLVWLESDLKGKDFKIIDDLR